MIEKKNPFQQTQKTLQWPEKTKKTLQWSENTFLWPEDRGDSIV